MFISRRKFLRMAGVTSLVATCTPNALLGQSLLNTHRLQTLPSALTGMQALSPQREMLLGYPVNREILPAEFFVWRRKLFDVGIISLALS